MLGIPENEELAATYYSQFDEEFEEGSESESDENDGTLLSTVKAKSVLEQKGVKKTKKSKVKKNVDSAGDEEMRVFITCMQNALDKNDTCKGIMEYIFSIEFVFIS